MERLLPALDGLPPVYLVGGAVRDLLLGQPVVDVDIAVEGDGPRTARELAARLGRRRGRRTSGSAPRPCAPARSTFDLAATRSETYPEPGALPVVEPAGLTRTSAGATSRSTPWRPRSRATSSATCTTRTAAAPTSTRASCGCCTTAASSTTRRASCAPSGTRCGSTSAWTSRPRSWRARRCGATRSRPCLGAAHPRRAARPARASTRRRAGSRGSWSSGCSRRSAGA